MELGSDIDDPCSSAERTNSGVACLDPVCEEVCWTISYLCFLLVSDSFFVQPPYCIRCTSDNLLCLEWQNDQTRGIFYAIIFTRIPIPIFLVLRFPSEIWISWLFSFHFAKESEFGRFDCQIQTLTAAATTLSLQLIKLANMAKEFMVHQLMSSILEIQPKEQWVMKVQLNTIVFKSASDHWLIFI